MVELEPASGAKASVEDIVMNSAQLEDFFYRNRVRIACDTDAPLTMPREAMAAVAEWTNASDARILSIAGPDFEGDDLENPTSILAAKFVNIAQDSRVPLASYFCELRRGAERRPGITPEMQALIELVYALTRQMVELMLPEFESTKDFSKDRFESLDGSEKSIEEALAMLGDLVDALPGKVFCIIDGLQWLDDRSTQAHLNQLIDVLRSEKLKVLFTTSGQSRCLLGCLSRSELLVLDGPLRRSASSSWQFEEAVLEL